MKKTLAVIALSAALAVPAVAAIMPHTAPNDGRTWAAAAPIMPHV